MVEIKQDFIPAGRNNRPATNSWRAWYKKIMSPEYITIHNAWSTFNATKLNIYMKSDSAASRPASWHLSIDEAVIVQGLPFNEPGFHAGDNLGPGNGSTIGIEICDYAILYRNSSGNLSARNSSHPDYQKYLAAEDLTAKTCAYLINTIPSLKPYPECLRLRQHFDWSGKNCPSHIRGRKNGWEEFVKKVGTYLGVEEEQSNMIHRVLSGSFTSYFNAETRLNEIVRSSPSLHPYVVYNKVGDTHYYRVVSAEHKLLSDAQIVKEWLDKKGYASFVVSAVEFVDLPFPEPEPLPDPMPDSGEPVPVVDDNSVIVETLNHIVKLLLELIKKLTGGK